jgi:predicted nucleic acid-binding protein
MPVSDRLIETTILVDLLRGKNDAIAWVNSVVPEGRWVSVVTYFELLAGCRNRGEARTVDKEMRGYRILHVTETASHSALEWFQRLHLSHGVGFLDSLIAGTALTSDLILATLNTKHFDSFPGLQTERPY